MLTIGERLTYIRRFVFKNNDIRSYCGALGFSYITYYQYEKNTRKPDLNFLIELYHSKLNKFTWFIFVGDSALGQSFMPTQLSLEYSGEFNERLCALRKHLNLSRVDFCRLFEGIPAITIKSNEKTYKKPRHKLIAAIAACSLTSSYFFWLFTGTAVHERQLSFSEIIEYENQINFRA